MPWSFPNAIKLPDNVTEPIKAPRATVRLYSIPIDSYDEKVYWTDYGTHTVQRADINGENIETLVTDLLMPRHIALDLHDSKMYWTDSKDNLVPARGFLEYIQRETWCRPRDSRKRRNERDTARTRRDQTQRTYSRPVGIW